MKSGGIEGGVVEKMLGRSDCWGDKGGMAQINIPSSQETIIAVFVANVYPANN